MAVEAGWWMLKDSISNGTSPRRGMESRVLVPAYSWSFSAVEYYLLAGFWLPNHSMQPDISFLCKPAVISFSCKASSCRWLKHKKEGADKRWDPSLKTWNRYPSIVTYCWSTPKVTISRVVESHIHRKPHFIFSTRAAHLSMLYNCIQAQPSQQYKISHISEWRKTKEARIPGT